jgi:hypothetical protein
MTLGIMTLGIMTLGITTLSITTTDKLKLTGRNLGRVFNSKLGQAFVYGVQLHT